MLKYIVKYYLAKNLACIRKVHSFYKNENKGLMQVKRVKRDMY